MASTKLTRAYGSGVTGNRNKWTISGWYKLDKGAASSGERTMLGVYSNASYFTSLAFLDDGKINFMDFYNGGLNGRIRTNALHKDTNGWFNVVGVFDKDNSTSGDKMRLWVNGVRITGSLAQYETMPSQASTINSDSQTLEIGTLNNTSHFSGIMSHLHFCDGYAYDASYFGSTDSTTGEWKINTSPSVSYGTQGWFWLKDNIATTDNSPNSNTFTVSSGTLTKTEDNPSNVFATINPLSLYAGGLADLQYGNTEVKSSTSGSVKWYGASTLAFTKGKFYCEIKNMTTSNPSLSVGISMNPSRNQRENHPVGARNSDIGTENYSGNIVINNSNVSVGYGSTWTADGDICMLAVDADNNKFYIGKNGVWADSDNPSNGTGGYDMSSVANHAESTSFYHFAFGSTSGTYMNEMNVNFGNGYFGTTAVATNSGNGYAGAEGSSIFNYQPPTGYSALSTKGLNQ